MWGLMKYGEEHPLKKLESVTKSVGLVILARMSSSRLPGKALKLIQGKETLKHILDRLAQVMDLSKVILATSDDPSDDPLEEFASRNSLAIYRGSLEKVAERFYAAAKELEVDYACRINGDNIFLAPEILKSMIDQARSGNYVFLSNVLGRTYPKGMSVEIVSLDYYAQKLPAIQLDSYCNEHVMVCLYGDESTKGHYYLKNTDLPEAAAIQLALDTPEDWERSNWILEAIPSQQFDLETTFDFYQRYEKSLSR